METIGEKTNAVESEKAMGNKEIVVVQASEETKPTYKSFKYAQASILLPMFYNWIMFSSPAARYEMVSTANTSL